MVVWFLCDNLPYVRYYGFGNYIVSTNQIIVYSFMVIILRHLCSLFNHSCHTIIENDLVVFS